MRALNNDMKIKVIKVSNNPISVDTIEDLKKIRILYKKKLFNQICILKLYDEDEKNCFSRYAWRLF